MGVLELADEEFEPLAGGGVIIECPRAAQLRFDAVTVTLGQQIDHVAFLVPVMPTSA
jgi:hypothetical protein